MKSFSKDLQGAVEDYQLALANNDTARNILLNIANAKYGLKEYPSAIDFYSRFIKKYPTDPEGYYGRSNALWAFGDSVASMADVTKTLKFDPLFKGARHVLGIYKFRNKNYKGAIEDLTIAIVQNPTAEDFTIRGKAKFAMGANSSALEDYFEAIRIDPKYDDAYLNKALLQISMGRKKDACKNFFKSSNLGNVEASKLLLKYCSNKEDLR